MTTQLLDTEIVYCRETRDYAVTVCGVIVGFGRNFADAEAIRTRVLAERQQDGYYHTAELLDGDDDPFGDPRTEEEKQWDAEGWAECEGGWEKFGPHPFDPAKTVRHFRPRLFTAGPPVPPSGDDPTAPADPDPAPGYCETCGGEGRLPANGCGDQAGGYAETCQDCRGTGRADPDEDPTPPWDGPHPGRAIARQWHRDRSRFLVALRGLDRGAWLPLAEAYCSYMARTGPWIEPSHILRIWFKALEGDITLPARVHPLLADADASAESYNSL